VIDRAHAPVRIGDVLSFAVHGRVRVIKVEALPGRRGPPAEARLLYSEVGDGPLTSGGSGD
jgi:ribosome-associated heat shock protein Hsp15